MGNWSIARCQSAIVSIALSCTVFEIFDVEHYRNLEIKSGIRFTTLGLSYTAKKRLRYFCVLDCDTFQRAT